MGFISKKRKSIFKNKCIDKEFASEIVEIFEEKLSDLNVALPGITENEDDNNTKIKSKVKKELICEIEEFVSANKSKLLKKVA